MTLPFHSAVVRCGLLLQGGLLSGSGKITGDVMNTGGTVNPGNVLGTLQITGSYTQTTGATTLIDLGGTTQGSTYDLLKVSSLATLGGALDVELANGFTPTVGETFDFMTYGSHSEDFSQVLSLDPGFVYSVSYTSHTAILSVTNAAGVPETSTLLSATLMLATGGLLVRRRRHASAPTKRAA